MDFLKLHPFYDDFWREKAAKLDQITIPMLVCASFSDHGLHTAGSFRAFVKSKSSQKWVYTHRTGKWDAYYSPEVQQLTKEFMDCFLKDDTSSGFLQRAPVRLEVRSSRDVIHEVRDEQEWPLEQDQVHQALPHRTASRSSSGSVRRQAERVEYPAKRGRSVLRHSIRQRHGVDRVHEVATLGAGEGRAGRLITAAGRHGHLCGGEQAG